MYVGLSLSFCVRDIAADLVPLDQVEKIQAGTAAPGPEAWEELIGSYKQGYWYEDTENCVRIARQLLVEGKIDQPRLSGQEPHSISDGHWLEDGKVVKFW